MPEPTKQQRHQDAEFMAEIIAQICDCAVAGGMEPNNALTTVAENILFLRTISDYNGWKRRGQNA